MDRQLELALRDFVTFKTVSSDRSLREDCYRGAKYLCKLLVEVLGRDPLLARLISSESSATRSAPPTLLFPLMQDYC